MQDPTPVLVTLALRDRCEELDGAASVMFQQMDLEESSTHARASSFEELGRDEEDDYKCIFTLSGEEAAYVN